MQINKSLFPVGGAFAATQSLSQTLQKLQVQLATQQKASSLSELGRDRVFDLTVRSRLSQIDSYNSAIQTVGLRLNYLDNSITRLGQIQSDTRQSTATSGTSQDGATMIASQSTAAARLDEVLTLLNGDINGRYMFAGNKTDAPPVVTATQLIEGDGVKAGLRQIITERGLADTGGAAGTGRTKTDIASLSATISGGAPSDVVMAEAGAVLHPYGPVIAGISTTSAAVTLSPPAGTPAPVTASFSAAPAPGDVIAVTLQRPDGSTEVQNFTAVTGVPSAPGEFQIGVDANTSAANFGQAFAGVYHSNTITLAEDGVHPFGLKLNTVSTTSAGISVIPPTAGPPSVASVRVDAQPVAGDEVKFGFKLPDGTTTELSLKAVTTGPASAGQFVIGVDTDATAANISAAMSAGITNIRDTSLSAASATAAANSFITGRGQTAMRVSGPPFETATTLVAANPATTVTWYSGSDSPGNARQTATARVDESTVVNYGVQANEQGFTDLVRSLGVLAAQTSVNPADPVSVKRYQEMTVRQNSRLSPANNNQTGSIQIIAIDLGLALTTNGAASDRHKNYSGQLNQVLSDIESAPIDEVATQLMAVQTRLQASYQTMANISKLTLVNFIQ